MSRPIKFRLYNKHDKRMYIFDPHWGNFGQGGGWVGGVLEEDYEKKGRTFAPSNQYQLEPESCEWLEFTGLLDKNGKEIFEGDVVREVIKSVKPEFSFEWASIEDEKTFEIKIPETFYQMGSQLEETLDEEMDAYKSGKFFEVIGNIKENPELLEKQ